MSDYEPKRHELELNRKLAATPKMILRMIMDLEAYSTSMKSVKDCRLISKDGFKSQSSWEIVTEGIPMKWRQEECVDLKAQELSFSLIEGDMAEIDGVWQLEKLDVFSSQLRLNLKFALGLPQVEDVIGDQIARAFMKNFEDMMDYFEERANRERYNRMKKGKRSGVEGFAVVGHPYNYQHLIDYFKYFRKNQQLPSYEFLAKVLEMTPSYISKHVASFKSKTGAETRGCFVMCPIIPDMVAVDIEKVSRKVIEACKSVEKAGIGIATLGGFTSIVGEKYGKELKEQVHVPVTTGNTYTATLTIQGVKKAAELMGVDLKKSNMTILGGLGDIGSACARYFSSEVEELTLTTRLISNGDVLKKELSSKGAARVVITEDNQKAIECADIIIAAASVSESIAKSTDFKKGAIVCDIGYPKNISYRDCDRKDILIFSGGLSALPDEFDLGFNMGLTNSRTLYGCFAEAILLSLEKDYRSFSWGKGHIHKEAIEYMEMLAEKHGFGLAPFYWGRKHMTHEEIERIGKAVAYGT